MKTFLVLCALACVALSAAVREKRGLGWGELVPDRGWQAVWHQPNTKVILVKKVVHVPREFSVPQLVHVHKVVSERRVGVVKQEVPLAHGHHGWL